MAHGLVSGLGICGVGFVRVYGLGRSWRSNPSGKCSQERLKRGTVPSTVRRAANASGCARCGAGAGCSAIKYQSIFMVWGSLFRGRVLGVSGTCLGLRVWGFGFRAYCLEFGGRVGVWGLERGVWGGGLRDVWGFGCGV